MKEKNKLIIIVFALCITVTLIGTMTSCPEARDPGVADDVTSCVYEAEDGTIGGSAIVMEDYYVGEMNQEGASITINNVDGGAGGSTNLTIMHATELDGPYTKSLYVNGSDVETLSFTPTGGWTTFIEYSVTITLISGTSNTIMLKNDTDDDNEGVNIDKFIVSQ